MNRRQWLFDVGWLVSAGIAYGCSPASLRRSSPQPQPLAAGRSLIRLDCNENPYGPSKTSRRAVIAALGQSGRYPWRHYGQLRELIADREGLSPEQVLLGVGTEEILRMAATVCALEKGEVVTPYPTYDALERYTRAIGARVWRVPLGMDFQLNLGAIDRATSEAVRLVYICNPNNPTGTVVSAERLKPFCEEMARRAVVLVDEAYHEYLEASEYRSMVSLVREGHQIIVTRTFSKIYGLAGLRIGYAMTRPDIAERLQRMRTAQGVNIIGLRAALASYQDDEFRTFSRLKNAEALRYLQGVLDELGCRYLPSQANFGFFKIAMDVRQFRREMRRVGVLVGRPFSPYLDWCRVSLGTMDEMEVFATSLRAVLVNRGKWPQ